MYLQLSDSPEREKNYTKQLMEEWWLQGVTRTGPGVWQFCHKPTMTGDG